MLLELGCSKFCLHFLVVSKTKARFAMDAYDCLTAKVNEESSKALIEKFQYYLMKKLQISMTDTSSYVHVYPFE